jgi:hypothetical protein
MFAYGASWQFHEFIPIPDFLFTTTPEFDTIVENRLSDMVIAAFILSDFVFLQTAFIYAFIFPSFRNELNFGFVLFFLQVFLLHFFVKVINFEYLGLILLGGLIFLCLPSVIPEKLVLIDRGVHHCAVLPDRTRGNLLEFVPVVNHCFATSPSFLQIVEHRFSRVIFTGTARVFTQYKRFLTPITLAFCGFHSILSFIFDF